LTTHSPEAHSEVDELCNYAVQASNRDFLLNTHCAQAGTRHADVFAKASAYAAIVRQAHAVCAIPFGVAIESRPGPTVTMRFGGTPKTMVMFASNDYLNLSTDGRIHDAVRRTLDVYGLGAGSSRVNAGYSALHAQCEARLARAVGKAAAIVFPTGYDAMTAAPQSLLSAADRVVVDAASHASILDGAHSSGATVRIFAHNSAASLEQTLQRSRDRAPEAGLLVMIEGAYSMDGDIANLPAIVDVCRTFGARLLVDEAHSMGVYGAHGYGVCEHYGAAAGVDMIAGTFSKSFGAIGGFLAADEDVILYMRYMCRRSVFSAALPPVIIAAVMAALDVIETDIERRERLWSNVAYLRRGLAQVGAQVLGTETASVPVRIGNDGVIFRFGEEMMAAGIFTFPAVYPTVPKNHALFRLAVQAAHEQAHLDLAISTFERLLRKYGLVHTS
jgi:7-keto-8-aminopelargonate synthetase-like enzyme